jgi:hypothetical protein
MPRAATLRGLVGIAAGAHAARDATPAAAGSAPGPAGGRRPRRRPAPPPRLCGRRRWCAARRRWRATEQAGLAAGSRGNSDRTDWWWVNVPLSGVDAVCQWFCAASTSDGWVRVSPAVISMF